MGLIGRHVGVTSSGNGVESGGIRWSSGERGEPGKPGSVTAHPTMDIVIARGTMVLMDVDFACSV